MLDSVVRSQLAVPLDAVVGRIERTGIGPTQLTAIGFGLGIGACVAAAGARWWIALLLWLLNRLFDGLDGALARRHGLVSDLGGFFDIIADFTIYAGVIVGVAYAEPDARLAAVAVLFTYYVSGAAFLAWSSLAEKRRLAGDGRSLHFPTGLAEGTETVIAYAVLFVVPDHASTILWVWCGVVGITAVQRVVFVGRSLGR